MLERFKKKLKRVAEEKPTAPPDAEKQIRKQRKKLGKEYQEEVKEEEEELAGDDWMTNKFEIEMEELRRAKDANMKDIDTYDIYDPRNPMNKRRREGQKQAREVQATAHRDWMRDRDAP